MPLFDGTLVLGMLWPILFASNSVVWPFWGFRYCLIAMKTSTRMSKAMIMPRATTRPTVVLVASPVLEAAVAGILGMFELEVELVVLQLELELKLLVALPGGGVGMFVIVTVVTVLVDTSKPSIFGGSMFALIAEKLCKPPTQQSPLAAVASPTQQNCGFFRLLSQTLIGA